MDNFDGDQAFISDGSSPVSTAAEVPTALLSEIEALSGDLPCNSSSFTSPGHTPETAAATAAAVVAAADEEIESSSPPPKARDQVGGERTPEGAASATAVAVDTKVRGDFGEQLATTDPSPAATEACTDEPATAKAEGKAGEEEEEDDDDDDDEEKFQWGAAKHVFVLSSAGKPVFSLLGDEQRLSTLMGLIQALLALCADCDDGDEMESISAGSRRFVFLKRGNLVLVAVSSSETCMLGDGHDEGGRGDVQGQMDALECESFMRLQLEYLYASILFLLTSKVQGIFLRSPGYDLRGLLGGADTSLRGIIELAEPSRGRGRMLASGVETVWMDPAMRSRVARALQAAQAASATSGALYAIWVCGEKLVSLAQPRAPSHRLTSRDLLLLVNFVATQPALRTAESWTPVCFPRFQETGYLYAYIAFLEDPTSAAPPHANADQKPPSPDSSSPERKMRASGGDGSRGAQSDSNGKTKTGGETTGVGGESCIILVSAESSSEQFEAFRRTRTALESRFRSALGTHWDRYLGAGAAVERGGILTKFCTQMQALHFYYCLRGKHGGAPCVTQCLSSPFVDPRFANDPAAQRRVWGYYTRAALRLRRGSCQEGRVVCRRGDSSSSADWIFKGAGGGGGGSSGVRGGAGGGKRSPEARGGGGREDEQDDKSEQDLATALFESDPEHSLAYEIGENITIMSLFGQREDGPGRGGRWTSSSSGDVGSWGNRDELHACFPSSVSPEAAYKAAVRLTAIVRRDWEWLFVTGTGSGR